MNTINVYVTANIGAANLERLRGVSPRVAVYDVSKLKKAARGGDAAAMAALKAELQNADVIFGGRFPRNLIKDLPRLKWIQLFSAGNEGTLKDCPRRVSLTNNSGVNALAVAEHTLHLMLMLAKSGPQSQAQQQAHQWRPLHNRMLAGRTVGIIGLGSIGREVARRCRAFGMRVIAVRRHAARHDRDADELLPPEHLKELLAASDYVVLAVPYTPATDGFFGDAELAAMRPESYLINIARGKVIDEAALIRALREKQIAGAGLDVTQTEPLPPDSQLWELQNAIITPHAGGAVEGYVDRATDFFRDNLARYIAGKRRRNVVNRKLGY